MAETKDIAIKISLIPGKRGECDEALVQCDHVTAEGFTSGASLAVSLPSDTVRGDVDNAEQKAAEEAARLLDAMTKAVRARGLRPRAEPRRLDV